MLELYKSERTKIQMPLSKSECLVVGLGLGLQSLIIMVTRDDSESTV